MGRTACTEPQWLYKGALYLYLYILVCWESTRILSQKKFRFFLSRKLWNRWQNNERVTFEVFILKVWAPLFESIILFPSSRWRRKQLLKRRNINIEHFTIANVKILTCMRGLNYSSIAEGPMPSEFLRLVDYQVPTVRMVVGLFCPRGTTVIWSVTIYHRHGAKSQRSWMFIFQVTVKILTFSWPCISVYLSQYLIKLDAQNLFHNKFYFMPLHVSSTCARNM